MRSGGRNSIKSDLNKGEDGGGTPRKRKMGCNAICERKEKKRRRGKRECFRLRPDTEQSRWSENRSRRVNIRGQLGAYLLLGSHFQASSIRASRLNK